MPSDAVLIAMVTGTLTLMGIMANAAVVYFVAKLNTQAAKAAVAAGEVKQNLESTTKIADKKLDDIAKVGEAVHVLVNNNMGIQLKISAVALRRIANMNKDSKEDQMAAKLAEAALKDHEKRQAELDSMKAEQNAAVV